MPDSHWEISYYQLFINLTKYKDLSLTIKSEIICHQNACCEMSLFLILSICSAIDVWEYLGQSEPVIQIMRILQYFYTFLSLDFLILQN